MKKKENILKDWESMELRSNDFVSFSIGFPNINEFLDESECEEFKHNNRRLEKKFNKIGKLLWDKGVCPTVW